MRQFVLPDDWDGGPTCLVEGGRARYISRVLRLSPGDAFPGIDSAGRRWTCTIVEAGGERLVVSLAPAEAAAGSQIFPRIVLAQALLKGPKMDLVVRQATEAGVAAIVPVLAARSVAQGEGSSVRRERWERIIREAMQQSGSTLRTGIADPAPPRELPAVLGTLGIGAASPRILLHEAPLAQSSMHGYLVGAPESVALCVGPEGGFSPDEVELLLAGGFSPLRFAGAILRAETAALFAVASARIILSESSSWIPKSP